MAEFATRLQEWRRRLTSRKTEPVKSREVASAAPKNLRNRMNGIKKDVERQHGAEGNAFQVNGEPDDTQSRDDNHRHGAEGDAFQVNGRDSQVEDDRGDPT